MLVQEPKQCGRERTPEEEKQQKGNQFYHDWLTNVDSPC